MKKAKRVKKDKTKEIPVYKILYSIKRTFSRSPIVKAKFDSAKIIIPKRKANGEPSKAYGVLWHCECCRQLFPRNELECDHIEPVIPVEIPTKHMSWDVIVNRCCVTDLNKLQILCKNECHRLKSYQENVSRREWKERDKHLVYRTTNSVTGKDYIGYYNCTDFDDGHLGSGPDLEKAFEQYGKDKFYRKVLFVYDNHKDALDKITSLKEYK